MSAEAGVPEEAIAFARAFWDGIRLDSVEGREAFLAACGIRAPDSFSEEHEFRQRSGRQHGVMLVPKGVVDHFTNPSYSPDVSTST